MYDLQLSDDVGRLLTSEGVQRLRLGACSRRRAEFSSASGPIESLLPPTIDRVTLVNAGSHLCLLRDGRRWLEFSDAARQDASQAWLAVARRAGRALVLYGPGLGGDALTP